MALIQIDLDEYNSLTSKVKVLEKILVDANAKIKSLEDRHAKALKLLSYLMYESTLIGRIFKWRFIVKKYENLVNNF